MHESITFFRCRSAYLSAARSCMRFDAEGRTFLIDISSWDVGISVDSTFRSPEKLFCGCGNRWHSQWHRRCRKPSVQKTVVLRARARLFWRIEYLARVGALLFEQLRAHILHRPKVTRILTQRDDKKDGQHYAESRLVQGGVIL